MNDTATIDRATTQEMRNWCADCVSDDEDIEYIEEAPDEEIVFLVAHNYGGGVRQFLADAS